MQSAIFAVLEIMIAGIPAIFANPESRDL